MEAFIFRIYKYMYICKNDRNLFDYPTMKTRSQQQQQFQYKLKNEWQHHVLIEK